MLQAFYIFRSLVTFDLYLDSDIQRYNQTIKLGLCRKKQKKKKPTFEKHRYFQMMKYHDELFNIDQYNG